jgi:hypothetical protein
LNKFIESLTLSFALLVFLSACSRTETQVPALAQNSSPSPIATAEPSSTPAPNSPIRAVDFENFTYPRIGEPRRTVTLRNGEEQTDDDPTLLVNVIYGDVTEDGNEEAMVVHTVSIRGTAIPHFVYIYTMNRNKPRLLWSFDTGDRAEGGLRQVYAENGRLVVELYGKNKFVGGDLYAEDDSISGACCPSLFTRAHYEWRGNRFRRSGQLEVLPNPEGNASYLPLLSRR